MTDAVRIVPCYGVKEAISHVRGKCTLVSLYEALHIKSEGVDPAPGKVTELTNEVGLTPKISTPDENNKATGHEEKPD